MHRDTHTRKDTLTCTHILLYMMFKQMSMQYTWHICIHDIHTMNIPSHTPGHKSPCPLHTGSLAHVTSYLFHNLSCFHFLFIPRFPGRVSGFLSFGVSWSSGMVSLRVSISVYLWPCFFVELSHPRKLKLKRACLVRWWGGHEKRRD